MAAFPGRGDGLDSQLLLAGEGAILKVYKSKSSKLVGVCRIFTSQVIHGIALRETNVAGEKSIAIWGGRSFTFLSQEDVKSIVAGTAKTFEGSETLASDWILDGAFSPSTERVSCVFITAHNEAIYVSDLHEQTGPKTKTLSSASRSILYSAHVTWMTETSIMVAAGTVFGEIEIIVWSIDSEGKSESGSILTTFTGHEGSIFGVQISPELRYADDKPMRILASCSDDRTIRLWDISMLDLEGHVVDGLSKLTTRETGFGGKETSDPITSAVGTRCIAKAMGHASRIWRVRFIINEPDTLSSPTPFNILSFGEDCTVQQWILSGWPEKIDGAAKPPLKATSAVLNHLNTYTNHIGKHIWSTALLDLGGGSTMVATGGADGAIATFEVRVQGASPHHAVGETSTVSEREHYKLKAYTPPAILEQFGGYIEEPPVAVEVPEDPQSLETDTAPAGPTKKAKKQPVAKKDVFNKYAFVNGTELLFTTTFGKVIVQSKDANSAWKEASMPAGCEKALRSYSGVASLSNRRAMVAGASGQVFIYTATSGMQEVANLKCKVAGLFELPEFVAGLSSVLATTLGQSEATIITLNAASPEKATRTTIQLPPSFVVTSARVVDGLLVLGCRSGKIALYDTAISSASMSIIVDKSFECRDAITSIVPLPDSDKDLPHFVITARNGKYGVFAIHKGLSEKERVLELLHYSLLPFGPMIEGASFVGSSLIIHGFRSQSFIAWDETKQREVLNVKCGGAHRNYAFTAVPNVEGASVFAYTKASELCLHEQLAPAFQIVKEGGHGREIKASAVSGDQQLIATAAEDTNIRIWSYAEKHNPLLNKLECHAVLRKHSAGIQHLQWAETAGGKNKYLFSAGGVEEFCVWAVSWIPDFGLGVVCEATLDDLSEERDLRIMSFHAVAVGGEEGGESTYLIAIAFSDSTIRAYWYDRSHGFEKLATGRYTSACLTQIHVMPTPTGETMVLTGSTDGHLQLWQIGDEDEETNADVELIMKERVKVHQSGILTFDILPIGQADYIVATGGDDNAAALTCLGPAGFGFRTIVPSAHAAAVSGVTFVAHSHNTAENAGTFRFCTVGGDQKVKKWTVAVAAHMDETGALAVDNMAWNELENEDEVPTTVSDAAGVVTFGTGCSHKHCMVFGNGIEIFEV